MTYPNFGMILPIHRDLLQLAGYVVVPLIKVDVIPKADEERIAIMREGWFALVVKTGQDFGCDLARWVAFLETDEKYQREFTHPYGYQSTIEWIQDAIEDRDRQRLVTLIESDGWPEPAPSRIDLSPLRGLGDWECPRSRGFACCARSTTGYDLSPLRG